MLLYPYKESFQYDSIQAFFYKLSRPLGSHRLHTYFLSEIDSFGGKSE